MQTSLKSSEGKAALDEIARWCAEAGFPVSAVRRERDVLVLVPERLDALPDVRALRDLARRIQGRGYRHVAFSVEPEVEPEA